MINKINIFKEFIDLNKKEVCITLIILVISVILGIIYTNKINLEDRQEIIEYIREQNDLIVQNKNSNINIRDIVSAVIKENLTITFIIIILGTSSIFRKLVYLVIGYKGFGVGYVMAFAIMTLGKIKGVIFNFLLVILPNLCILVYIMLISILWLNFEDKNYSENLNKKFNKFVLANLAISTITLAISSIIYSIINIYLNKIIKIL